jgi:GNAT superfamily N-acetyltransferase
MSELRLARREDLAGVLALYRELRPDDPQLSTLEAKVALQAILEDATLNLIVCEHDQVLVATCMLAIIRNLASGARPFAVLEHVVTLAAFRRQGFARMLLRYALELAWSQHCCKVVLLSGAERAEAHALYESVGFRGDIERGFVAKP